MRQMSETKFLSAEAAIDKAFEYFNKYVRPDRKAYVLLEGLELSADEREWRVTIGFDIGRQREVSPATLSFLNLEKAREPIRQFSTIHIDASDGSFIKLA